MQYKENGNKEKVSKEKTRYVPVEITIRGSRKTSGSRRKYQGRYAPLPREKNEGRTEILGWGGRPYRYMANMVAWQQGIRMDIWRMWCFFGREMDCLKVFLFEPCFSV